MKCDELKYEKLGDMMPFYPRSTLVIRKQFVDAAIAELKRENRKLKRALWLARANYCHNFKISSYISRHPSTKRTRRIMENTLIIAELKCRAKAEEYK